MANCWGELAERRGSRISISIWSPILFRAWSKEGGNVRRNSPPSAAAPGAGGPIVTGTILPSGSVGRAIVATGSDSISFHREQRGGSTPHLETKKTAQYRCKPAVS